MAGTGSKGFIFDMIIAIILLLSLFIVVPIGSNMLGKLSSSLSDAGMNDTASNVTAVQSAVEGTMDAGMVIVFIALVLIVLSASAVVFSSPVFFIIGMIGMLVVTAFSMVVSNVGEQVANSPLSYTSFPMAQTLISNLPVFMAILMVMFIIIFYAKRKGNVYDV